MNNRTIKYYLMVFWPLLISVIMFCAFIPFLNRIQLTSDIKTLVVSLMFTMLGFSITAVTIIAGFMKDSKQILFAFKKGYFITLVSIVLFMFIASMISLFACLFDWPSFIYISVSASVMFSNLYLIYIIFQLIRFLIKSRTYE